MAAFLGFIVGTAVGFAGGWLAYRKWGVKAEEIKDKVMGE